MLNAATHLIDERLFDTLRVAVPNTVVVAVLHLADLKTLAELGLILLTAAYTVWRWRRDAKKHSQ